MAMGKMKKKFNLFRIRSKRDAKPYELGPRVKFKIAVREPGVDVRQVNALGVSTVEEFCGEGCCCNKTSSSLEEQK